MKPVPARSRAGVRLIHFTPLRYPGGKGKLAAFVKRLIEINGLVDGEYVEPYAGGAAIAMELLIQGYVSRVHINDISKPVIAFWRAVLERTEEFCRLVVDTPLTVRAWDKQRRVFSNPNQHEGIELGFATFFLNRTNRSGIFNAGVIGGRQQKGRWKIDARYNAAELVSRIETIARLRSRILVSRLDAIDFLEARLATLPRQTLVYLDPPYYVKGKALYHDFYGHEDHVEISKFVQERLRRQRWIVSYDNVLQIRRLYSRQPSIAYRVGYSAREARQGEEIMFCDRSLQMPDLAGGMRPLIKSGRA